jgi:phage terminase large subunit
MENIEKTILDRRIMERFQESPLFFIKTIWGLDPQPIREEYKEFVNACLESREFEKIQAKYFEKFVRGEHITWQQWLIVWAVEHGVNKISVVAGHGIGKDMICSLLIIWFLFCHYQAQVGATAPTSELLHDVLWKEIAVWMGKMPAEIQDLFEWQSGYIRVNEEAERWFARARTARKEAPEAIAGLHGDYVLILADEASGIPDEIYRSAEGSMTGPTVLVILIGNGTRNIGYFYDSHHEDKDEWQTFSFSSEDSPVVEEGYVERMVAKYGRESDEFKIRVLGGFPASEQMDDQGWVPLLADGQAHMSVNPIAFSPGRKVLAIDPSGEGDDLTTWVLRDNFFARVIASEAMSNSKEIAFKTLELAKEFKVEPTDIIIDNFGVGANVKAEVLLLDQKYNVKAMNWGEEAQDEDVYLNKRAECCFRAREWFMKGGMIYGEELKRDVLAYTYRNNLSGKRQIVMKPKLKKRLGRSPDRGDAFFMTFYNAVDLKTDKGFDSVIIKEEFNPYDVFSI